MLTLFIAVLFVRAYSLQRTVVRGQGPSGDVEKGQVPADQSMPESTPPSAEEAEDEAKGSVEGNTEHTQEGDPDAQKPEKTEV